MIIVNFNVCLKNTKSKLYIAPEAKETRESNCIGYIATESTLIKDGHYHFSVPSLTKGTGTQRRFPPKYTENTFLGSDPDQYF